MKTWMISGITGQDGSYISELLLERGESVCAIMRRTSNLNDHRIKHLLKYEKTGQLKIVYADLLDDISIRRAISKFMPDYFINLAAQSHVGISFDNPISTFEFNALGPMRVLEALKDIKPDCRFYQASSSEMWGISPPPQDEDTKMQPVSPYGISKTAAYWITRLYRNAYGMFATNGILHNHESVPKESPLIIKKDGLIDILPIEDIFKSENHRYDSDGGLLNQYYGVDVWNGENWTIIEDGTCYKDNKKEAKLVQTRESSYEATLSHVAFTEDNKEISTGNLTLGTKMFKCEYPEQSNLFSDDKELAKFIGFVVGDGYISKGGNISLTGVDKKEIEEIAKLISNKYGFKYYLYNAGPGQYENCKKDIWKINLNNDTNFGLWLRKMIYTEKSNEKRVPKYILNGNEELKKSFYDGYYMADGRKKGHEKYEYKGFTTSSQTLCLGLNYLFKSFSTQKIKTKCEYRDGNRYYYVQYGTPNLKNKAGKNWMKELNQVINITDVKAKDGWYFDIQTTSRTFATGPNLFKVHNSERRGYNFVTRKITMGIAKIVSGEEEKLTLGNLMAKRDWGFSKEYMEQVIKIMELDEPMDILIATDEMHTIQEFLEECFKMIGLNWEDYVEISEFYKRPAEVPALLGNPKKAEEVLGWRAETKFKELAKRMLENDLKEIANCTIEQATQRMMKDD